MRPPPQVGVAGLRPTMLDARSGPGSCPESPHHRGVLSTKFYDAGNDADLRSPHHRGVLSTSPVRPARRHEDEFPSVPSSSGSPLNMSRGGRGLVLGLRSPHHRGVLSTAGDSFTVPANACKAFGPLIIGESSQQRSPPDRIGHPAFGPLIIGESSQPQFLAGEPHTFLRSPHHRGVLSTYRIFRLQATSQLRSPHHRGVLSTDHRRDGEVSPKPSVPSSSGSPLNARGLPAARRGQVPFGPLIIGESSQPTGQAQTTSPRQQDLRSPHHRGVLSTLNPEMSPNTRTLRSPHHRGVLNSGPQKPNVHAGSQGWFETSPFGLAENGGFWSEKPVSCHRISLQEAGLRHMKHRAWFLGQG